ncbi:MAG: glycosyltransferase [Planctomycetaceae bacterium]
MTAVLIVVATVLVLLALFNLVVALSVQRMLKQPLWPLVSDADALPGLVVLCLRGGDPFLERSLRRLFQQDYPAYRVRIVLDSAEDSARPFVENVLAELQPSHVEVVTLGDRLNTCTYKMSGILWGTRDLPDDVRFVALMDGDTVPHAAWLRELATPLVTGRAQCTSGNRWYFPEHPTFGSMVRVCWGAGALIVMSLFRIPWGGTMAFRREVIEDERLRSRLRHAFSEDTTIGQFVREQNGEVAIDPRLMIVNYEQTGLRGFFGFDSRQLLAVRLQHKAWPWVVLYCLSGVPMVAYPLVRWCGLSAPDWLDIVYGVYSISYAAQPIFFAPAIRSLLGTRGESLPGWTLRRIVIGLIAIPLTQFVHFLALLRALTMRVVNWRGVRYRLGSHPRLTVLQPEQKGGTPAESLAKSA